MQSPVQLQNPKGICFDLCGRLLIADSSNNRVVLATTDGVLLHTIKHIQGERDFDHPFDVSVDESENVYIADKKTWECVSVEDMHSDAAQGDDGSRNQ